MARARSSKGKRKTKWQRSEDKRQKRVRMWMGIFIIGVMVLSSIAFIFVFHAPNTQSHTGVGNLQYTIEDNVLMVDVGQDKPVQFYHFPDAGVTVTEEMVTLLQGADVLVVAFDPTNEADLPFIDLLRWDLTTYIDAQPAGALLAESDQYNFPVMDCSAATQFTPFIQVINSTVTNISISGSCLTLEASGTEILYLRDQLLYAYFGVQ